MSPGWISPDRFAGRGSVRSSGTDGDEGTRQGLNAERPGGSVEAGRAGDAIPVGEGEGFMALSGGGFDQILGIAGGLQKGESASSAEFDVVSGADHDRLSLYFRY